MENPFDKLHDHLLSLQGDFEKFYEKGVQSAGTRVRQGMQALKELAQKIRMEVQNIKNEKKEK